MTLDDIEAVAATAGPGLIGALLVGVSTAKAIAAARRLPLIPVDHLQGHVAANFLEPEPLEPPFLCLVASGGHTMLAAVRDHARPRDPRPDPRRRRRRGLRQDGAPARPRLPGRPAGPEGGRGGRPGSVRDAGRDAARPRPRLLLLRAEDGGPLPLQGARAEGVQERRADLAASFQKAVVDQLVAKLRRGAARRATGRRSRSAAGSPPTGRCAPRSPSSASAKACA